MKRRLWVSLIGVVAVAFGLFALNLILGNEPLLGLDLQGGASVTLRPASGDYDSEALPEVANLYREKIEAFNIGEAEVVRQGDTIVVNLPGVKDKDEAIELIGTTGKVTFRPVLQAYPGFENLTVPQTAAEQDVPQITITTVPGTTSAAPASTSAAPATSAPASSAAVTASSAPTVTTAAPGPARAPRQDSSTTTPAPATTPPVATVPSTSAPVTTVPTAGATTVPATTVPAPTTTAPPFDPNSIITPADQDVPEAEVWLPSRDGTLLYHLGPQFSDGETAIDSAEVRVATQSSGWEVVVTLTPQGLAQWNVMASQCYSGTEACPGRGMAIIIDHRVISAPVPNQPSFDSTQIVITNEGGFGESDARQLSRVLKYGASPIEMRIEASQTVSATLGEDTLRAAIVAGIIGVLLVLAYMFLYYRKIAVVVVGGMCVSGLLIWSVVSLFEQFFVLTLAGVLGIIVSVGITADSYIVYFERLKTDTRNGRSLRSSAQRSFSAAWRTILAADSVSLLSSIVLWYLSVGSVRGFALFLGLSTVCDMIVAYFYTRPAVALLAQREGFQGSMFGVRAGEALAAAGAGGGA